MHAFAVRGYVINCERQT